MKETDCVLINMINEKINDEKSGRGQKFDLNQEMKKEK